MNISKIGLISVLVFMIGIFTSCEEENATPTSIITEDVIYLSGERLRLLGRIITTQNVNAEDHGFYISENELFNQPLIISLGERINPGRFIGEIDGLNIEREYFTKSFIEVNGEIQFGNTIEIKTLSPEIEGFSPINGPPGTVITLTGKNFTSDTRILFGDRPAQIISIDFESRITARVPQSATEILETITVIIQDRTFTLPRKFEYTTGKFTRLANPPSNIRLIDNIYFKDNDNFYAGLGSLGNLILNPNIWRYNLNTEIWDEVNYPGIPLWLAFATNNYLGGGAIAETLSPFPLNFGFWKIQNGNFEKLPDSPFGTLNPVSFELGDNLYLAGGTLGPQVYKYSKQTGNWSRINNLPFLTDKTMMNFSYGNSHYITNPINKEIYAFDPDSETWSFFANYPGDLVTGSGIGVNIGDRVYLGLNNRSIQFWELNMSTRTWAKKNDFIGIPSARNVGIFEKDGNIYLLRRLDQSSAVQIEFWKIEPNSL